MQRLVRVLNFLRNRGNVSKKIDHGKIITCKWIMVQCSVYCWKKIIIYIFLRVCKSNVYSVSDLDYLFSCLIISLFTYCIRDWGVVAYTKYLSQIDRPLRRGFRFGFIQHEISIQQVTKDTDLRFWYCGYSLASPAGSSPLHLRAGLYVVGRILTRSHVLILRVEEMLCNTCP